MNGCIEIPFSTLFADTVKAHGMYWAYHYYVKRHHMPEWEFRFWCAKVRHSQGAQ